MVKGIIYDPLDMDCLLALWPLLLLVSLVTCKVWSFDLYLKKLPCNMVYITHTEFNKAPLFHQRIGSWCPSFSLSLSLYFSFFLSLSYRRLRTTRFRSIKGSQQMVVKRILLILPLHSFSTFSSPMVFLLSTPMDIS